MLYGGSAHTLRTSWPLWAELLALVCRVETRPVHLRNDNYHRPSRGPILRRWRAGGGDGIKAAKTIWPLPRCSGRTVASSARLGRDV